MEFLKQPKNIVIGVLVLVVLVLAVQLGGTSDNVEVATIADENTSVAPTDGVVTDVVADVNNDGKTPDKPAIPTETAPKSPVGLSPAIAPTALPSTGKAAPELQLPSGFSNSEPFKLQDIVGKKVIVLAFQNYTSKNSQRTSPYLNMWHERYRNKGLSVITVHTPRFAFDRTKSFVDQSAFAQQIIHPIVLDNQFATANAWGNKEWPTFFLVDINGKIANSYKGEGKYEAIEARIVELLKARTAKLKLPADTYPAYETPKGVISVDFTAIKSPEIYFGTAKNTALGNGTSHLMGIQDMKPIPEVIVINTLYLSGSWEFTSDSAKSSLENNRIVTKYNAKNVYTVLGSLRMNKVRITLDGMPLGALAGRDVREEKGQSYIYVTEERIYDIVKGGAYGEHTLEMVAETSGLEVYDIQFG